MSEAQSDQTDNLISYDEFTKVNLVVGTIIKAEPHPDADKLMVLQVALGNNEMRQIVAGIKQHYTAEQLFNTQIVVVTNLKPVKLRGVESHGMLLAASDDAGTLALIRPDKDVSAGSRAK